MQTDSHSEVVSPDYYYAYSRHTEILSIYCIVLLCILFNMHVFIVLDFTGI